MRNENYAKQLNDTHINADFVENNNDLTVFLKNTEKALRNNTVQELNAAVLKFLKDKDEKVIEVSSVLNAVAEEYQISKRKLLHSLEGTSVREARKMAYCLLHFDVGLTTRYIAQKIFNKWQTSVSVAIQYYKQLDKGIKEHKNFLEKYERLQLKISTK